jgi:hypothetical protein
VDIVTPATQVTRPGMADCTGLDEALAGVAVFGEGSGPALDGVEVMAEALGGVRFIPRGAQATLQPTGHTT